MKPLVNIILLVTAFLLFSFSPANFIKDYFNKLVIDIGHGGKDPGTVGVNSSFEKDVAFKVATQLGSLMEVHMPQVSRRYTRYGDEFIAIADRPRLANKEGADLYISVHANASSNPAIRGTETYVMGITSIKENIETAIRENRAIYYEKNYQKTYEDFNITDNEDVNHILFANRQKNIRDKSIHMAWLVEQNFQGRTINRHSRGVKNANFLVLWKTTMPSVLVEIGYLSNSEEEQYLNSEEGIYETASALFRAIRDYKEFVEK
jgi:N-acetylmuramoyl-L-alanine amidase